MLFSKKHGSGLVLAASMFVGACTVSDVKKADTVAPAAETTTATTTTTTRTTGATGATTTTGTMTDSAAAMQPVGTPATGASTTTAGAGTGAAPATTAGAPLHVEVDLKARKLYLYEGDKRVETHSVAVGSTKWPTQTGEWTIKQVVFNPEWVPPDETWAEEKEPRKPGDPKNPLGRAQLVYDPPRTIHGTNMPSSIGTATSHGSIRMRNEEVLALGKRLMTATGAGKDAAWYQRTETDRSTKQIVDLPRPVPIRVY